MDASGWDGLGDAVDRIVGVAPVLLRGAFGEAVACVIVGVRNGVHAGGAFCYLDACEISVVIVAIACGSPVGVGLCCPAIGGIVLVLDGLAV